MEITFWGVRGSIPAPLSPEQYRKKIASVGSTKLPAEDSDIPCEERDLADAACIIGGNTPCVEIRADGTTFIIDMGSGLREFGIDLMKRRKNNLPYPKEMHVFISHTHWDHIQGFPFFQPAFLDEFKINFYSPHGNLRNKLALQQEFTFFPVSVDFMNSDKAFPDFPPESSIQIGAVDIRNTALHHPGVSYAFRFSHKGKSVVYASDGEYNNLSPERINHFISFFSGADLLIFDAMYTLDQEAERVDWGHSSPMNAVDIAVDANVKTLALFHHDPENDDEAILRLYKAAKSFKEIQYPAHPLEIIIAREMRTVKL